jgi:hypothetical protein
MKKGKKKYLLVALLLALVGVGAFVTYAIYHNSITGNGTINTAAWVIKFTKKDTTTITNNFTFDIDDVTWTNRGTTAGETTDTIAPGAVGTITFEIIGTGSQVPIDWTATVGTLTNAPSNGFTAVLNETSGHIAYSATQMKKQVTLTVTWTGDTTNTTYDNSDQAKQITIPVTLTAQQCTTTAHGA